MGSLFYFKSNWLRLVNNFPLSIIFIGEGFEECNNIND